MPICYLSGKYENYRSDLASSNEATKKASYNEIKPKYNRKSDGGSKNAGVILKGQNKDVKSKFNLCFYVLVMPIFYLSGNHNNGKNMCVQNNRNYSYQSAPMGKSVVKSNETGFQKLPQDLQYALHFHTKGCVLCNTKEHTLVNCPLPYSVKKTRIMDLKLCEKCLRRGHYKAQCRLGKIYCVTCGSRDHLSYIRH